jgi:hypothetical protein
VQQTPGQQVQSVAQASFDAWIRYYRVQENTPNATVSYYTKGALAALAWTRPAPRGSSLDGDAHAVDGQRRRTDHRGRHRRRPAALQPLVSAELAGGFGTGELPLKGCCTAPASNAAPASPAQRLGLRVNEALTGVKATHVLRGARKRPASRRATDPGRGRLAASPARRRCASSSQARPPIWWRATSACDAAPRAAHRCGLGRAGATHCRRQAGQVGAGAARGMAHALSHTATARRRIAFAALVLGVLAVHGWLTGELAERMGSLDPATAMPPRIEVAYVRELALEAPPAVAPVPPPPALTPARRPRAPKPAASSPELAQAPADPEPPPAPPARPRHCPNRRADGRRAEANASGPLPPWPLAASAPQVAASAAPAFRGLRPPPSYKLSGNVRGEVRRCAGRMGAAGQPPGVHLDIAVGLPITPMSTRRMSPDGELTEQGLTPNRYDGTPK